MNKTNKTLYNQIREQCRMGNSVLVSDGHTTRLLRKRVYGVYHFNEYKEYTENGITFVCNYITELLNKPIDETHEEAFLRIHNQKYQMEWEKRNWDGAERVGWEIIENNFLTANKSTLWKIKKLKAKNNILNCYKRLRQLLSLSPH